MIELIVSQGRVADRTARTIIGAALTAQALEQKYTNIKGQHVGKAALPASDPWQMSLLQAKQTLTELAQAVNQSIKNNSFTIMVSNTCPASLASLPVVAREYPDAVVLWIDAHGDFNTPEITDTGYLGGMVLAATCGLWESGHGAGLRPENVILLGARDIDKAEKELLQKSGVRIISPTEATPEIVLKAINDAHVWIHIDWDVLEPGFVPADYEVPNGLLPDQLCTIFKTLPSEKILGIELAEFNAPIDVESSNKALSIILDIVAPILDKKQVQSLNLNSPSFKERSD